MRPSVIKIVKEMLSRWHQETCTAHAVHARVQWDARHLPTPTILRGVWQVLNFTLPCTCNCTCTWRCREDRSLTLHWRQAKPSPSLVPLTSYLFHSPFPYNPLISMEETLNRTARKDVPLLDGHSIIYFHITSTRILFLISTWDYLHHLFAHCTKTLFKYRLLFYYQNDSLL